MDITSQRRIPKDHTSDLDVKIPSCGKKEEMNHSDDDDMKEQTHQEALGWHPLDRKHGFPSLLVVVRSIDVTCHPCEF